MKKPVLFLNFNRPACTAKSFEQIRKYKPSRLYISVDAPRSKVLSDKESVSKVKEILSHIDWNCDVQRWYANTNQGCRKAVQSSLAKFFKHEEEGIILEDDCVPTPAFFKYMEEMLERYRSDERIGAVHGHSVGYRSSKLANKQSYFFTQLMNMWGWGTWRRAFELVDNEMSIWQLFDNKDRFLARLLEYYDAKHDQKWITYWKYQFTRVANDEHDTWDYQWIFNMLENRMFCIAPTTNMIENIGWGSGATHTHNAMAPLSRVPAGKMRFPLKHPDISQLHINRDYEEHIKVAWCGLQR